MEKKLLILKKFLSNLLILKYCLTHEIEMNYIN